MSKKSAGKDKSLSPTITAPRGFAADAFEDAAQSLLKHVDSVQRYSAAIKKALAEAEKTGVATALATTDAARVIEDTGAKLVKEVESSQRLVAKLSASITQWRSAERGSRRVRFEAAAKALAWNMVGSWPEPVINGYIYLVVDEEKGKATVNGRSVQGQLTAERLVLETQADLKQITLNLAKPVDLVSAIWKAFRALDAKVGDGVLVFDLLRELLWQRQAKKFQRDPNASQFRPYPLAQFRADLTHYLEAGAPTLKDAGKNYTLDIVGGSFAEDGIFMYFPQTDRLATCGRLTFREQES